MNSFREWCALAVRRVSQVHKCSGCAVPVLWRPAAAEVAGRATMIAATVASDLAQIGRLGYVGLFLDSKLVSGNQDRSDSAGTRDLLSSACFQSLL